ncbi:hypothetical protein [Mucilaginibacter jinjuensis]|uniref:Uncharacterized protein n=1 Tax=Mucilaginibacter jinjuensis TaxID=1176721 RepID=A0ABY7TD89_9SPHI|nr:hypothetical protein [Mucilaginibacter jinjuensis]WCT14490.1 hypothetical protein PQO05_11155 [Mucilaginibacter jinjuensis]
MKKLILISAIFLFSFNLLAQKRIVGSYYYLEHPSSDVFTESYGGVPNGTTDPHPVASDANIVDADLLVKKSSLKQTSDISNNHSNSFLYNTWSHNKNVQITGKFFKVKRVILKNDSWGKFHDNLWHPVEGLKADSVIFTIKYTGADSLSTTVIDNIVKLFVGKATVVGKIYAAMAGTGNSTTKKAGNIATIIKSSKDSVSFTVNDSTVYYAVRYAQIGSLEYEQTSWLTLGRKKIKAPDCVVPSNEERVDFSLPTGNTIHSLIGDNCDLTQDRIKVNFNYDHGNAYVVVTDQLKNSSAGTHHGTTSKPKVDTLYNTGPIDFKNEYLNRNYSDSFQFVSNRSATKHGSVNEVVVADFALSFNPKTGKGSIYNYEDYYHTCVYTMHASIKYFPK